MGRDSGYYYDMESSKSMSFAEQQVRLGFIRKVFGILFFQLLITMAIGAIIIGDTAVKLYIYSNPWTLYVSLAIMLVTMFTMMCFGRMYPVNMILLTIFTVSMGFLVGTVSSTYDTADVVLAAGITAVLTLALICFAMQTKIDFTIYYGIMYVFLLALILFGLIQIILAYAIKDTKTITIFDLMISCAGAFLMSCFIIIDVQMMMGGSHMIQISPDDYVFAALNLYLDIINLFLYILRIIGDSKSL